MAAPPMQINVSTATLYAGMYMTRGEDKETCEEVELLDYKQHSAVYCEDNPQELIKSDGHDGGGARNLAVKIF